MHDIEAGLHTENVQPKSTLRCFTLYVGFWYMNFWFKVFKGVHLYFLIIKHSTQQNSSRNT